MTTSPYKYDLLTTAEKKEIIDAFNQKSKTGIELLAEKLGTTDVNEPATDVDKLATERAHFFITERDKLDLDDIGDYLGDKSNSKTLTEFFNLMSFENLEFTEALRQFLTAFNLPGEGQKIDRIMEAFAQRYAQQNPNKFKNADAAYVLAVSVIMLNTDLHNPAIIAKKKITLDQFIKNNRRINDGEDFPSELLTKIYDEIKENEIKPNVTKIAPGFTISAYDLAKDKTYQALTKGIKNPSDLIKSIPGLTPQQSETYTAQLNKPKKWLHKFLGYEGMIVIKDKDKKEVINIQVYTPGVFSRNKDPKVIIQPVHDTSLKATKDHIKIAARLAASFRHTATVKATYDYAKVNLVEAYHTERGHYLREQNVRVPVLPEDPPAYEHPPAYDEMDPAESPDEALPPYSPPRAPSVPPALPPRTTSVPVVAPQHPADHHKKRHGKLLDHFKRKKEPGHVEGVQAPKKSHGSLWLHIRKKTQSTDQPTRRPRPRPTPSGD